MKRNPNAFEVGLNHEGLKNLKASLDRKRKSLRSLTPDLPPSTMKNMKHKFDKGDIVSLSCGGPSMVIEAILCYDDRVHPSVGYFCTFIHEGRVERNEFAEEALVLRSRNGPR